jgi:hypothetical protein
VAHVEVEEYIGHDVEPKEAFVDVRAKSMRHGRTLNVLYYIKFQISY